MPFQQKRMVPLVVVLLASLGLFWAFWPRPIEVQVEKASMGPMVETLEYLGKTRVKTRYTVSASGSAQLQRVTLREGDAVTEGQELAVLFPPQAPLLDARSQKEAWANVAKAKDAWQTALSQVESTRKLLQERQMDQARLKTLYEKKAATAEEYQKVQFDVEKLQRDVTAAQFSAEAAKHELERARATLQQSPTAKAESMVSVVSPIDGVVLRVLKSDEGPVTAGVALLEVGSLNELEVVVEVQTPDAVLLRPGMTTLLSGWGKGTEVKAKVQRIEPSAFKTISPLGVEEQRVKVIVDFDLPVSLRDLGDGFDVTASFVLWEAQRVLRIPHLALFRQGEGWAVWTSSENRARLREVKIGHTGDSHVEVLEGLSEGEPVVLDVGDKLSDGTRLRHLP